MLTTFHRKTNKHKLNGLIVSESEKFLLLLVESDFQFNGYQIIRKSDIVKKYSSDSDAYCMKLMKKEKSWKTQHPKWVSGLDLTDWHSIFSGIKCNAVIVQNEKIDDGFCIGPIGCITKTHVTIHMFDTLGIYSEPDIVKMSSITTCIFLDRYSLIHAKYLKPHV